MNTITFQHITFGYQNDLLFDDAMMQLYPNRLHFLIGESGTGKNTLLKILTKKLAIKGIKCNLSAWHKLSSDKLAYQLMGYQLIDHGFMQHLTVKQNIIETKKAYQSSAIEDDLIELFHFQKQLNQYPHQLSGGQKRILSIILSLMKNLPIMLLDEPTSSLDPSVKSAFLAYLKSYARKGYIVLMATNDEEILDYADVLIKIEDQKLHQTEVNGQEEVKIKRIHHRFPYRLKSIVHHQLWYRGIQLCLIIAVAIFLGHSFYLTSDVYTKAKGAIATLQASYPNTAYVYCEGLITNDYYLEKARVIDESLVELLKQNNNIEKVYPYYAFPVGIMNYYDEMNMFTKNKPGKDDVIITEALNRKLGDEKISIANQPYQVTNVMEEDMNKMLRETRYMIYVPTKRYPDIGEALYYVLLYQDETELKQLAITTDKNIDFLDGTNPDSQYQDLQRQLKGYRLMLPSIALVLGGIAILIRLIFERKYHHQLLLLKQYGFKRENDIKLQLQTKFILLLMAILVIFMPLFNREIPFYNGITAILYLMMEVKLSFFGHDD